MLDAIKKLDKKFLITFSVIIFLPIIIIVLLVILQSCSDRKITYGKYEEKMVESATKYINAKQKAIKKEGQVLTIKLKDLINEKYIKSPEKLLKDDSCSGKVIVRRNGSSVEDNDGGFLNYIPVLECEEYKTNTLISKIKEDLVSDGSGVYLINNEYVFKGSDVKNYISIDDVVYRIINIDEKGFAKLLDVEENISVFWDMKYNVDTDDYSGINIYKDSSILDDLKNIYIDDEAYPEEIKRHLVAKDVCVGPRTIGDLSIYNNTDCNVVLEDQFISLIDISDYAKASLDKNCTSLDSWSCSNYSYFEYISINSWLANSVSNDTYQVFYLDNGVVDYKSASEYETYNKVIYIDGNEIVSGKGTKEEPYILTLLEK